MAYVIFDLEWNQCPYGKEKENPKLPFEIIEIGAVKMDGERNVVGTFHRIVKPVVYQHLHHRTREVVGLTEEDLQNGIPFAQAVQEFFAFSGGACMFGTWGPGDLTELQRNMKFYNLLSLIRGPIHFYDVQKLFAIQYETMKSRRALEYAADFLHLPKDEHFHQALSDAKYTADIFARIDMDVVLAYDSIDVYQNPKSKKEEIHAVYNGYTNLPRIRHKRRSHARPRGLQHALLHLRENGKKTLTLVFGRREKLLLRSLVPGARIFERQSPHETFGRRKTLRRENHPRQQRTGGGGNPAEERESAEEEESEEERNVRKAEEMETG